MNELETMRQAQLDLRAAYDRAERQVALGDSYANALIDALSEMLAFVEHGRKDEAIGLARMLADTTGRLISERYRDGLALGYRLGSMIEKTELKEKQFDHWAAEALRTTPMRPRH